VHTRRAVKMSYIHCTIRSQPPVDSVVTWTTPTAVNGSLELDAESLFRHAYTSAMCVVVVVATATS